MNRPASACVRIYRGTDKSGGSSPALNSKRIGEIVTNSVLLGVYVAASNRLSSYAQGGNAARALSTLMRKMCPLGRDLQLLVLGAQRPAQTKTTPRLQRLMPLPSNPPPFFQRLWQMMESIRLTKCD